MRNAKTIIGMAIAAAALAACGNQQQANELNVVVDEPMPGGIPPGADVEALPADESSTTPSDQLQNGIHTPEGVDAETANAQ